MPNKFYIRKDNGAIEVTEAEWNDFQQRKKERRDAVAVYADKVSSGEIAFDDVPEEYTISVKALMNKRSGGDKV